MDDLISIVREAWRNATQENDYDFSEHTDRDVALDMLAYDAFLEYYEPTVEDVEAAVKIVRAEKI